MQNPRKPPKASREPPLPQTPKHEFNFDDDIFQTENQSLEKFKIINIRSIENKKFKSYTNEFKVKILKSWTMLMRYITYSMNYLRPKKREESLAITICSDSSSKTKSFPRLFRRNSIRCKIQPK